jgi:hypothetical protein
MVDNDDNGFVDCDDFACALNPTVTVCEFLEDTDEECSDMADNDDDGFVDCDDLGCSMNPDVTVC